jgi:hypothetical protein
MKQYLKELQEFAEGRVEGNLLVVTLVRMEE